MSALEDRLQPAEIKAALSKQGVNNFAWLYRETTESTNDDVLRHYDEFQQTSIAFCETQTAGKGRRGRQWLSPFAQNIYCTVGIVKSLSASHLGLLSIASGLALCQALASSGINGVKLKWPNDLVYQRKKLGGILIESKPIADNQYFFAIGFGVNVNMTRSQLDEIPQPAISIGLISPQAQSRQQILINMISRVVDKITNFDEAQTDDLVEEFALFDAFSNQSVCVLNAEREIHGINAGINQSGQLKLQTEQGLQVFSAAEISLRGNN